MEIDREECPGCGSEQAFRPRWRYHSDRRFITVFIGCTVCPWTRDIRESTTEIEKLRNRLRRHEALALTQRHQFGEVSGQTRNAIAKLREEIAKKITSDLMHTWT